MVDLVINDGDELLTRLWNNVISRGVVNRRLDSSRLGLLLSAIASEQNTTISLIKSYMSQFALATCTDKVMVENLAKMFAVRRVSSKSKVVLQFYRLTDNNQTIKINGGFKVGSTSDSKIAFRTISDAFLWKGTQSTSVIAYSVSSGKSNNVDAGVLNKFETNGFNTIMGVINPEPAFGGYNEESIESLRSRATGFRYNRDGTESNIRQLLYDNGIAANRYSLSEYNDGPGSFQICIDTSSEAEFEDVKRAFMYRHWSGVTANFIRAERAYVNIYVAITTTGEKDYTPLEKQTIYNHVTTRIQRFFAAYCAVGIDLNVGSLKSALYSELSSYEIENIELSFDQGIVVNNQNIIYIPDTYRVYPNKIITDLNYNGQYIYATNDEIESEEYDEGFDEEYDEEMLVEAD